MGNLPVFNMGEDYFFSFSSPSISVMERCMKSDRFFPLSMPFDSNARSII